MNDKERLIYAKNINSYFLHYTDATITPPFITSGESKIFYGGIGFYTPRTHTPKFPFREKIWSHGIVTNLQSILPGKRKLDLNTDGTGKLVSILPNKNKRMIIHRIEIKLTPNIIEEHKHFLKFSLLRVKRNIHTSNVGQTNNLTNNIFIASDSLQLVEKGCFFSNSVVLTDLNYDMTREDDLILIEKIEIDRSGVGIFTDPDVSPLYYTGFATSRCSNYDVVVHYSLGEI